MLEKPRTVAQVVELLGETINQVRAGEIDIRAANAVGFLAMGLVNAIEKGILEQRLAQFEAAIAARGYQFSVLGSRENQFSVLSSQFSEQFSVPSSQFSEKADPTVSQYRSEEEHENQFSFLGSHGKPGQAQFSEKADPTVSQDQGKEDEETS